ncbi:MAG: GGDEF domain-containing protein [Desulfuromonadaceae bacterium]|nr:GGDEF domain-containing protein [Desulfuromonadaceae bacterium]MDD2849490.1 GGDEF domain-containing protein [Desulfuromonadaceae bacterium]MDD4130496.1 GGDEF domain-containing protein [Desulfuromonadaceae bacterium]
MFYTVIKRVPIFVVPVAILIATWFLIPHIDGLTPAQRELVVISPYLLTALGMFVAVHFHRGRPFMALLLLIVFYWSSSTFLSGEQIEPALSPVYQAFVILIPLNMLLFTIMRERGLFSTAGRLRFIFLAVQAAGAVWLFRYHFTDVIPYIAGGYTGLPLFSGFLVPQPAMVVGAACFTAITLLALRRQAPIESGMLGALVAFFIASNWLINRDIHAAYTAAGALIVTLSILRDSYNMAFRDDLTGIPSRRSLNESLHGLGRNYTVAMLDVDHFKRFNDTYGHDVGDQVLKVVAQKMMGVGGGGRSFRYGGEEFTILFAGCRVEDALPHLEELRKAIADYRMVLRSGDRPKGGKQGRVERGRSAGRTGAQQVSVTVSIGVAESGENLKSTAEVMKAADKALYKAKNKGRNQVSR